MMEKYGKMRLPHISLIAATSTLVNQAEQRDAMEGWDHAQFAFSNRRQTGKSIRHTMLPAENPLLVFASFTASPRKDLRQRSDEILTRLTLQPFWAVFQGLQNRIKRDKKI